MFSHRVLAALLCLVVAGYLLPFDVRLFGFLLRSGDVAAALLGLLGVGTIILRKRLTIPAKIGLLYALIALFVYRAVNGLLLAPTLIGLRELIHLTEFTVITWLLALYTSRPSDSRRLARNLGFTFLFLAVLTAAYSIAQGNFTDFKSAGELKYSFGLACLYPVAAAFAKGGLKQTGYAVLALVAVVLMVLSGERKSWVGLGAGLVATVWILHKRRGATPDTDEQISTRWILLGGGALVAVAVYAASQTELGRYMGTTMLEYPRYLVESLRAGEVQTEGLQRDETRLYLNFFTIQQVQENPLFGTGSGTWSDVVPAVLGTEEDPGAHSEVRRYAVENGLTGLGLYLLVCGLLLRQVSRYLKSQVSTLSIFMVLLTVYALVVNLFLGGGGFNILLLVLPVGWALGSAMHRRLAGAPDAPSPPPDSP